MSSGERDLLIPKNQPSTSDSIVTGEPSASSSYNSIKSSPSSSRGTSITNDEKKPITGLRFAVVCFSLYFGVFVAALDGTVVTSLLSHIASDLHELPRISWIATGYLVACAAFQPLYGKISDIFGRKRVLMFSNIMFGFGCLLCGVSNDLTQLVAGRVISGIGGGGMLSLSTIALSDMVPLRQRGIFQGIGNISFGIGAGVGGIFGGIISDRYGWRMAFNCQVPAVFISSLLVAIFTPANKPGTNDDELVPIQEADIIDEAVTEIEHEDEGEVEEGDRANTNGSGVNSGDNSNTTDINDNAFHPHRHPHHPHHPIHYIKRTNISRVDFSGSFTLVSTLVFLMIAIATGGRQFPWNHPFILASFTIAAVFLGLFVYVELSVAKEPVIPLQLLTHRTILASSLTNMFMTMSVYTILFFVPVCLTSVYDMNPTEVGKRLSSNFLGVAMGSFGAGIYMKTTGRYYYLGVVSPLLYIGGVIIICQFDLLSQNFYQVISLYFCGLGYAAMLTVTLLALIAAVPHEFQAITTSIQYAFRGIGSTLGVAISSSIFQNILASRLYKNVKGPDAESVIQRVLDSVEEIRKVPIEYQPAIIDSYKSACLAVFITALVLAIVSTFTSGLMGEHKLHNTISRNQQDEERNEQE